MSFTNFDGSVAHSFGLDIDGGIPISISEVKGLKLELDVVETKVNTPIGKFMTKQQPGRPKPPEITLVRPKDGDTTFEDWIKAALEGNMATARKNGSIIEFDYLQAETKRWNFERAWPKSWEISDRKAGSTDPTTETLVLVTEACEPG